MNNTQTLQAFARADKAKIAAMLTGPHGIGKSSVVHQFGQSTNRKMLDVRLGQMTEGDILGLFKIEGDRTITVPPDWLREACDRPCILFLDELNRALPSVVQGVFQLVLDRRVGSHILHADTLVVAAINTGAVYQVFDINPALVNRFMWIEFTPSIDDFLAWAQDNVHPLVYKFVSNNRDHIEMREHRKGMGAHPTRRSWHMVSRALADDLSQFSYDSPNEARDVISNTASCLVGDAAAAAFSRFLAEESKNLRRAPTADEVLDGFQANPSMLEGLPNEDLVNIELNMVSIFKAKGFETEPRMENFGKFMWAIPREHRTSLWRQIQDEPREKLFDQMSSDVEDALGDALDQVWLSKLNEDWTDLAGRPCLTEDGKRKQAENMARRAAEEAAAAASAGSQEPAVEPPAPEKKKRSRKAAT